MRILHTSDWHLGTTLCGRRRYDEAESFLDWLADCIRREGVQTLIVAGDVFDTTTPSNRALEIYYRFLGRISRSGCRHVVITAGNHDSPSLLAAPRELLSALDIHVVGGITENPAHEVFMLRAESGEPELILCAIPFLRDKDILCADAAETIDEKNVKLLQGIRTHYQDVCTIAQERQNQHTGTGKIPIIATGHLFAAGGTTREGDGVRELTIGSLVQVGADTFPDCIDYLALGHLHQPQLVSGSHTRRYCGSPLTMGFQEEKKEKQVLLVDITKDGHVQVEGRMVPATRRLMRVSGDAATIGLHLAELKLSGGRIWVEVHIEDPRIIPGLREQLHKEVEESNIEILRIKNTQAGPLALRGANEEETLEDLNPIEVFTRCLDSGEEPPETRDDLMAAYKEILAEVLMGDLNEE
ncbi:MAG TPA: exonuclease SbcCD subunit D C-terminal domain-containing protein [Methanospirillum sp.]|nr:exonuclease SbcCD subunit D C-terminal domain-containing protein [Methanospirillum sp.]